MAGRLPLLPTLMVALAVPLLIGLGVWQLQRAEWKAGLLAALERNRNAPLLLVRDGALPPGLDFRHVRLMLDCGDSAPQARAGRNAAGQPGYAIVFACTGHGATILLNAGWGPRPDSWTGSGSFPPAGAFAADGVLVRMPARDTADWTLVATRAPQPLLPSAPPSTDTIPNNHRAYAFQWFGFAAILAAIYGLWLRRWLAQRGARP